jgi:hypothetical protein
VIVRLKYYVGRGGERSGVIILFLCLRDNRKTKLFKIIIILNFLNTLWILGFICEELIKVNLL